MKKRQIKKIINSYYWDTEEDIMLPPSVMKEEFRAEEVYYSKAFIISNPEKAAEFQKKVEERIEAETTSRRRHVFWRSSAGFSQSFVLSVPSLVWWR